MKNLLTKILFTTATLLLIIFICSLLIGVGQIIHYLRFGDWLSISALDLLVFLGLEWAKTPASWAGVFRILEWLPLSLFSGLGCIIFLLCAIQLDKENMFINRNFAPVFESIMTGVVVLSMTWFGYTKLNVSKEPEMQNQKETNGELKGKSKPNGF